MKAIIALLCLVISFGCTANRSYRRIPSEYTEVRWDAVKEIYLIELNPAFGDPMAKRFTFNLGSSAVVEIQSIGQSGPGRVSSKTSVEAASLLRAFRSFDWASPENIIAEDEVGITPDEMVVTFKARTPRVYRELRIGLSQSDKIAKLVKAVFGEANQPNKSSDSTTSAGTSAAGQPRVPASAASRL